MAIKTNILIYDSNCLICSKFINWLDNIAYSPINNLIICSPESFEEAIKLTNIILNKKLIHRLKEESKYSILLITEENSFKKSTCLIKTLEIIRPKNKFIRILNSISMGRITKIFDIIYIFFSKNRLRISFLIRFIYKLIFRKNFELCNMKLKNLKVFL